MGLTRYVLVVVAGVAISGLVVWQLPAVTPSPSPRVSVAAGNDPAPVAIGTIKEDAAPAAVSTDAPKVAKTRPTPTVRREPRADVRRAVAEVSRAVAEPAPPTPATDGANATARITDEPRVSDATRLADEDSARALVALQQHEYGKAFAIMSAALDRGGKATFTLVHDHTSGNFDSRDPKATCVGELTILGNEVRFESTGPDRFAASWADVRDTGANKFFGAGIGGFHVTINAGGKHKNFNLAPQSRDKAEGKLILDLLRASARGPGKGR